MFPRVHLVVVVVAAVLVVPGSTNSPSFCPCINSTDRLALDALLSTHGPLYGADISGNATGQPYGIGCHAHDITRHFCRQATDTENECQKNNANLFPEPPKCLNTHRWCQSKWCYVDRNRCSLNAFAAPGQSSNSTVGPIGFSSSRTISYAACGSLDTPTTGDSLRSNLVGKTLKVAILENSGGWMGSYKSSKATSKYNGYVGPVVDIIDAVQREASFRIDVDHTLPLFAKAIAKSSSKFTQCVALVGLGYYDLCIGDFSITSARHLHAEFFTLKNDPVYLISRIDSVYNPSLALGFVFLPFQGEVWTGLACFILLYAIVGFLQEIAYGRQIKGKRGNTRNTWVSGRDAAEKREKCIALTFGLWENIFSYFAVFFSGGEPQSRYDSPPLSSKFTLVSLAWLVTLSLAVYTGEAASIFSVYRTNHEVESIEAAVAGGHKICCSRATTTPVMELYPTAIILPDPVDSKGGLVKRTDIFKYMEGRQCDVGVITKQDLEAEHSANPPRHCDIHIVGDPITYVGRGVPIISNVHRELSWHLQRAKNKGLWTKVLDKWRPTPACSTKRDEAGEGLSLEQMSGVFLSSFSLFFIGLVIDFVGCCSGLKCCTKILQGNTKLGTSFKVLQGSNKMVRGEDGMIELSKRGL